MSNGACGIAGCVTHLWVPNAYYFEILELGNFEI